jgi:hypothetical protein
VNIARIEGACCKVKKPAERILYGERRPDGSTPFWRMPTIWSAADGKPTIDVAIESLNILDEVVWFGGPQNVQPTVRRIAQRARDIFDADLSYPIIDWPPPDGTVDGTSSND